MTLQDMCERIAQCPLVFEPGTQWQYSNSFDVLGRVVEVVSGQGLAAFLEENIFGPLGMVDTGFFVPKHKQHRFAHCYQVVDNNMEEKKDAEAEGVSNDDNNNNKNNEMKKAKRMTPTQKQKRPSSLLTKGFVKGGMARLNNDVQFHSPPDMCAGGGGLVSTIDDYMRFCNMLLNKGTYEWPVNSSNQKGEEEKEEEDEEGQLQKQQPVSKSKKRQGIRILGRKTVEEMMMGNHLNGDMADYGKAHFLNLNWHGIGFGLGGSVVLNPSQVGVLCSKGEFAWGGMSSVFFWIDPTEGVACVFMTQLVPSSALPLRKDLRVVVNKSLQ
eukprot:m.19030 g.19030  ORF g.19030 m.19030 type:complete len:326 (-) comp8394_c0_seq1:257-1234(-)